MKQQNGIILFLAGFIFALLWSSASVATKIGLQQAQPFVICIARFFTGAIIMLLVSHVMMGKRLPRGKEWGQLAVYGMLNISIYLGLYVLAMQRISPGLGSLAIATNPVFISIISAVVFRQRLRLHTVISLVLCTAGVLMAAFPLFHSSYASPVGLLILLVSMFSYSAGVLYFSRKNWNDLHILTINGWQTGLGGLFLLPVMMLTWKNDMNHWNLAFIGSVLWLAIAVSIIAVQLWLFLLRDNALKASFWLFLCPVSGYIIAWVMMKEPIGLYTVAGMGLVLAGLYLVQRKRTA